MKEKTVIKTIDVANTAVANTAEVLKFAQEHWPEMAEMVGNIVQSCPMLGPVGKAMTAIASTCKQAQTNTTIAEELKQSCETILTNLEKHRQKLQRYYGSSEGHQDATDESSGGKHPSAIDELKNCLENIGKHLKEATTSGNWFQWFQERISAKGNAFKLEASQKELNRIQKRIANEINEDMEEVHFNNAARIDQILEKLDQFQPGNLDERALENMARELGCKSEEVIKKEMAIVVDELKQLEANSKARHEEVKEHTQKLADEAITEQQRNANNNARAMQETKECAPTPPPSGPHPHPKVLAAIRFRCE
jgi:hypothetical protein